MNEHDIKITHVKGENNTAVDYILRLNVINKTSFIQNVLEDFTSNISIQNAQLTLKKDQEENKFLNYFHKKLIHQLINKTINTLKNKTNISNLTDKTEKIIKECFVGNTKNILKQTTTRHQKHFHQKTYLKK